MITTVVGLLLIIAGIGSLAYQRFTYTEQEKIAQIGTIQVTADTEKTIHFPPMLSTMMLVAGVILVIVGRKK